MADTEVVWRGLSIGGGGPYHVESITGWDDLPDVKSLDEPRTRGHGDHPGDQHLAARIVTVRGSIASRTARDDLARGIFAKTPVRSDVEELTVETFGRQLRAGARLIGRSLPVDDDYPSGKVPFALQWKCPDPMRYGPERTLNTGLPFSGGAGLTDLTSYPLDYGPPGATGQITLTNEGDEDAPIFLEVLGGLPEGFEVSAAGRRLRYPLAVPSGQRIFIDNDEGTVLAEGTSDRRGELTADDWLTVPAAVNDVPGSLTLQFTSLGGVFDPAADLLARVASTYS